MNHKLSKAFLLIVAAFMQGINVAIYPAAANLLTDSQFYGFSTHEYGALFIPMIIAALFISYFSGFFEKYLGQRAVLASALLFNCLSVTLFALSSQIMHDHTFSYVVLLIALFFYGLGFGSFIASVTPYLFQLYPKYTHATTVAAFGSMCLGAALSPILFSFFRRSGVWWLDPTLVAGIFFCLFLLTFALFPISYSEKKEEQKNHLPPLFWLMFCNMILYGLISTVYGNWITIYMHKELGFSMHTASNALAIFWGMQLMGRVIIIGGNRYLPLGKTYIAMPLFMIIATALIPFVHSIAGNFTAFAIAGFAFSATFPLTFSFAAEAFPDQEATVSGRITTAYIIGYGIAAYGAGLLYDDFNVSLENILFYSVILAVAMLFLSFAITQSKDLKGSHSE